MEETKPTPVKSPEISQSTPPPTIPVAPKPKFKPKVKLIILVIILLLFSILAFIYLLPEIKKASIPTFTYDTKAIPNDWKTYTNTKLGFSFKYPPIWKVSEDHQRGVSFSEEV